ncbi:MAG: class I SAM-dependent methyltransferase [Thermodesulfobacteriota bacterium]|nr:class I SAM-dependent methyltransferase [Thermodesulfobacteriota bacterium]
MKKTILNLYNRMRQKNNGPKLNITSCYSFEDYRAYVRHHLKDPEMNFDVEKKLLSDAPETFFFNGYCYPCGKKTDFLVDYNGAYPVDGVLMPNWRERLVCPVCGLNSRMRAAFHIFVMTCAPRSKARMYITEQTTPLFRRLKIAFDNLVGSEYAGGDVSGGSCNRDGLRSEDVTALSFDNDTFEFILSFDVFEHVISYQSAFDECFRCLKPGGVLFFTVPFELHSPGNIVRAVRTTQGTIRHIMPPEYHGDPLNPDGCLCYYHFGWEILDELKTSGFSEAKALLYHSVPLGYLGGGQVVFFAVKP